MLLLVLGGATTASAVTLRIHYPTGFGRSIAIRGSQPPLQWARGQPAQWSEGDIWLWQSPPGLKEFEFKPLLDDQEWSTGGNYKVPANAETVDVYPFFGPSKGRIEILEDVKSPQLGNSRRLLVYVPPSYDQNPTKRYPVLLMHDGQNLFDRRSSASTIEWQVDETLEDRIGRGRAREVLVVGIENTPARMSEYTPSRDPGQSEGGQGDQYLDFLEKTVLPLIGQRYRILEGPQNTLMMGSSLGGLISFHAAWTRPQVFGAVGCLSSSFWWNDEEALRTVKNHRGPRPAVRIYLDSGNRFDGAKTTSQMRKALLKAGWKEGVDLFFVSDPEGIHTESSWAERFHHPIEALLPFADEATIQVGPSSR